MIYQDRVISFIEVFVMLIACVILPRTLFEFTGRARWWTFNYSLYRLLCSNKRGGVMEITRSFQLWNVTATMIYTAIWFFSISCYYSHHFTRTSINKYYFTTGLRLWSQEPPRLGVSLDEGFRKPPELFVVLDLLVFFLSLELLPSPVSFQIKTRFQRRNKVLNSKRQPEDKKKTP